MEINDTKSVADDLSAEKLARHTCQLYSKEDKGKWRPNGSGIFVVIRDVHFLITAAHLMQQWSGAHRLFVRIGSNEYVEVLGDIKETDLYKHKPVDLAYVKIDPGMLADLQGHFVFLPFSKIKENSRLIEGTHYCIAGYPAINPADKNAAQLVQFNVEAAPQKVYEDFGLDTDIYYLLKGKTMEIKGKTAERIKKSAQFFEVSGCGLWQLTVDANREKPYSDYKLVGIITQVWDSTYIMFVGIKLLLIIDMIRKLEKIEVHEMAVGM